MQGQFHSRTSSEASHRRSPFRLTANWVENSGHWTSHWLVYSNVIHTVIHMLWKIAEEKHGGEASH